MRGSFRGSTIGFMEPENIRPQNSRSYSCSLTLREPVEIGKVGEVRPKFPFKFDYDGFARCGGTEDQAGAAQTSN